MVTTVELGALVWQEGSAFVSLCPELGVASAGKTPDDAIRMLREAVDLYLESARLLGITDEIDLVVNSPYRVESRIDVAIPWAN